MDSRRYRAILLFGALNIQLGIAQTLTKDRFN